MTPPQAVMDASSPLRIPSNLPNIPYFPLRHYGASQNKRSPASPSFTPANLICTFHMLNLYITNPKPCKKRQDLYDHSSSRGLSSYSKPQITFGHFLLSLNFCVAANPPSKKSRSQSARRGPLPPEVTTDQILPALPSPGGTGESLQSSK